MGSTLSVSQEGAKAGSASVTRSVGQAGSKPILSLRMRFTLLNRVADTTTILTTLVERHPCSLIDECTTIPSALRAWTSCRAGRTWKEGPGLIEVQHISVSATLQNGRQSRALSPRPSKEGQNSRKGSKGIEKYEIHDKCVTPTSPSCSSRVMYQSPDVTVVLLPHNPPCFAFFCCLDIMRVVELLLPLDVKLSDDSPSI